MDVFTVLAPDTGEGSGGTAGETGGTVTGGSGGFSDVRSDDVSGASGEVASLAWDGGHDTGVADVPQGLDGSTAGSPDSPLVDLASDGPLDVPLGRGGAGGSAGDAARDIATGGKNGSGGAAGGGGSTAKGGAGGSGRGGSGAGGAVADAAVSTCKGYQGVDGGIDGGFSQGLVAYYPCEQVSGTTLPDLSGNARNATLGETVSGTGGTPGASGYSVAAGKVNNALLLNKASKGYAALPAGILAGACEATIATWVYVNSQTDWQRIWDFGQTPPATGDATVYMFLATTNGVTMVPRFAISLAGNGSEQTMDGDAELPIGAWKHIAVVLGTGGGILYVDGVQVGANPAMTLRPADLGSTANNYLGRSQFSWDPYLDGNVDDFRVYNRALSPSEIKALFAYTGS